MNEKAFTLIEMLAVLIVIGLVVTIIAPKVSETINNTKMGAYESSVNTLLRKIKLSEEGLITDTDTTYTITDGVISPDIEYEGEINGDGYIVIDSDGLTIAKIYNNGTCAYKNKYDDKLKVESLDQTDCDLKITTTNAVVVKKTLVTTTSITVIADFNSNKIAKNYTFGLYKGPSKGEDYEWQDSDFTWYESINRNYFTFKNLQNETNKIFTYAAKVLTSDGETIIGIPSEYVTDLPTANITFNLETVAGVNKVRIDYEIPVGTESLYGFQYRTTANGKFTNTTSNSVYIDFDSNVNNITARVVNKINGGAIYTKNYDATDTTIPTIVAKNSVNTYIIGTDVPLINLFNIGQFGISGGTTICNIGGTTYTNVQDIPIGTYTLNCKVTLGNNLSASTVTNLIIGHQHIQ